MPKTRDQKEEIVKTLAERLTEMKSVVFINYSGLNVKSFETLRNQLREEQVECNVVKKTLIERALKQAKLEGIDINSLEGQVAVAMGFNDEVAPARILRTFQKDNEALDMLGGILEGNYIDKAKVLELADLPSREQLLAQFVGSLRAPLSGLVNVLQGNMRGLINALNAIQEQKA
ncbi:50S ribosomal protein L10 [Patescibacteria group bacterium]|nr:50S ribosomal protein L10 [Patescibacteria group bacterium]